MEVILEEINLKFCGKQVIKVKGILLEPIGRGDKALKLDIRLDIFGEKFNKVEISKGPTTWTFYQCKGTNKGTNYQELSYKFNS